MSSPAPNRRPPAMPRPFFTLAIVYIFGFFFVYALALVAPALLEVMRELPPGPEQQAAAERAAFEAASGKIGLAFVLSLATVVLGVWSQKLPGFRTP
ncbi:MAG: hypothetical protein JRH10_05525 [Deltaproteobacteria bacterium]|nr:hypothetical protein [Deltaproteobacteria bacterium]MBW2448418.1 hypothetical protein [Deltaproteobacteria bacterium]